MNIYVAGKTQDLENVRWWQRLCHIFGHTITFDWTKVVEDNGGDCNEVSLPVDVKRNAALRDVEGMKRADLLIALGHPNLCGTLWECGMAAASLTPTWLIYWDRVSRHSVFEYLPNVEAMTPQRAAERLQETGAGIPRSVEEVMRGLQR